MCYLSGHDTRTCPGKLTFVQRFDEGVPAGTNGVDYFTLTHRNSAMSFGHCTAVTLPAIAHDSVRRYSGT